MDQLLLDLQPQALLFVLIATRISALVAVAPVLSSRTVPMRIKAGIVILLSILALPLVGDGGGPAPATAIEFAMLAFKEAVIGFAFGLILQFLFAGIQTAGSFIDINAGFAIARTIDPTSGLNLTILGRWYNLIAISAFLAVGGLEWTVAGVVRSFALAPPMATADLGVMVTGVIQASDQILLVGLQVGAPLMASLLVTDVVLGLLSRAVPQMNVFLVGLPLKIVVALSGTAILMPVFVGYLNDRTGLMFDGISELLRATGGG
ncbi:MAG: flagellar biosynthetic protein FliR [Miltoncostaeaceae bacterium]